MAAGKAPYYLLPKQPFQLAPKPIKDSQFKALIREMKFLNLKHASRIEYKYDPFHPSVKSIRDLSFQLSGKKVLTTNAKCVFKTTIATDRSEPIVKVKLSNESELIYKTSLLTTLEIVQHLRQTLTKFDEGPETKLN